MRLSVILLACAAVGVMGGAWLIGRWTGVGAAVVLDSLALGVWAVMRDDGTPVVQPRPGEGGTLAEILERARRAS